ncbi:MAG: NADH-quinone oxidoreductase subunit NuoE [Maricaulaceae bacterium]
MSVRRLAQAQPESFEFAPDTLERIRDWMAKYPEGRQASAVIPALWIVQKQCEGWLPEPAMRAVADLLGMAYMRVYEVATFYTMFNLGPVGEHLIQVCGTTPCWLRGAEALKAVCEKRIGPKGSVSADGKFSWMEVECLGACVNAPMVQISNAQTDAYFEDFTAESFEALLDRLAGGEPVRPGPQSGRDASAPEGEPTSLTEASLYDGSRAAPLTAIPNAPRAGTETETEAET